MINYRITTFVFIVFCFVFSYRLEAGSVAIDTATRHYDQYLVKGNDAHLAKLYAKDAIAMFEYKPAVFGKKAVKGFYQDVFAEVQVVDVDRQNLGRFRMADYSFDYGTISLTWVPKNKANQSVGIGENPIPYNARYLQIWQHSGKGQIKLYAELYGSTQYYDPATLPHSHVEVIEQFENQYYPDDVASSLKAEMEYVHEVQLRSVNIGDAQARLNGYTDNIVAGRVFKPWVKGKESLKPEIFAVYRPEQKVYAWHRYYHLLDLGEHILTIGHFKGGLGEWENGTRFEGNFVSVRMRSDNGQHPISFIIANNDRGFKSFVEK